MQLRSYFLVLIVFSLCTAQAGEPKWVAPPLEQSIVIRDGKTKEIVAWDDFIADLAAANAVFLGESHTDEATHELELAVYQALVEEKQNKVILGMEMFERDVQPALNEYLAGRIDEKEFLKAARPWTNYREGYRPLVENAKAKKLPVLATNFPGPLRRRMMMEGDEVLKKLSPEEQRQVPREFHANTTEYWKRVDNATRGHQGMMSAGEDAERLYSTQSLWDNSMGEACANALEKNPDHLVLHVNGGFHSEHWDGTVHQLRVRKPAAKIKTVAIVPATNPATVEFNREGATDFIVAVEARATNLDQGKRKVQIEGELEYRFHLPKTASDENRVPLLIWLPEDGLTAEEGMEYARALVCDEAAVAVIDAPYKSIGEDLAVGRSWYWPETFSEDAFAAAHGIEEIWAYLLRHYPIDPNRVCVAGEGAGATVAVLASVHADDMDHKAVAFAPQHYIKLKDVPLPEFFGADKPPRRSLLVVGDESQQVWWEEELTQYRSTQMECDWTTVADAETQIRNALGIEERQGNESSKRPDIVLEENSARARHWRRLQSIWLGKSEFSTNIEPKKLSDADVLPKCPGPFGGTTVLVLPDNIASEELAAWLELEKNDPLAKESRFHRVRIAQAAGERSLDKVLTKLKVEKRTNVLIVPAEFFARPDTLRSLRDSVESLANEMTLNWLPGLGGRRGVL